MPSHGGIERILHERVRNFESDKTLVITPKVSGWKDFDAEQPYKVERTSDAFGGSGFFGRIVQALGPIFRFLCLRKSKDIRAIECGQAFPYPIFCRVFKAIWGIPYIVWVHGNDLLAPSRIPVVRGIVKNSLRNSELVITNSSFVANLVENQGVPSSKIKPVGHVVDAKRFYQMDKSEELIKRYSLESKKVLLSVGRLVERKGFDLTIRALPKVLKTVPDAVFLIVGDGPQRSELETMIKEHHLEDHVVFAGMVAEKELTAHYNVADVFVMVSRFIQKKATIEGLGLVYLEAGACGLPVVAGRSGGVVDVVHNGENGFLVKPESVDEIADAIERLLKDDNLREKMGRRGFELATRPTNWEIFRLPNV